MICLAPHRCQCQRKLCAECQDEHNVDLKYIVSIPRFKKKVTNKLNLYTLNENSEIIEKMIKYQKLLNRSQAKLIHIFENLSNYVTSVYKMIEQKNLSFVNLINEDTNLAESSYNDLEKLVQIAEGTTLEDWNEGKISLLKKMDRMMHWFNQEINSLCSKEEMNEIYQIINSINQTEQVVERKKDFYEVLIPFNNIDIQIFKSIFEILSEAKISDFLGFLDNQQHLEQYVDRQRDLNFVRSNILKITNIIRDIKEHDFNKYDYSTAKYQETKQDLIEKISQDKMIIEILQFLVRLTAIDKSFIQCGSNALNLLVDMKVDLQKQSFENIRIKNTSLIGANFVRCNFSGSEFNNVDLSGINLNGTQLFNCKWNKIRIHELNNFDGHSNSVHSVCFSPDGNTLASASEDYSIRLWDIKTGKQKVKMDGHSNLVRSVCFSPDGTTLASGSDDCSIRLWDVKTGQQKFKLNVHTSSVLSVQFTSDGTTLVSSSADKSIRLLDVKTGQEKFKLDGHIHYVWSVCLSPDGANIASGSYDKSIRLWDAKTRQQKAKLDGHSEWVSSVCYSPDSTTLASGSGDKSIRLWDAKTGQQKAKLDGHSEAVRSVCFSPGGTTLASSSDDKSILLWDIKSGQQKAKLDGHSETVRSVCFSPDGTTLASSSDDKSIRLWDVKTQQEKLDGHPNKFLSVSFSPDYSILASSYDDNSTRLWDVKTGKEIQLSDMSYQECLVQFPKHLFQNNPLSKVNSNITLLIISSKPIFQAQGAFIFKGEFADQLGIDLRTFFKQSGGCLLENQIQLEQEQI
ncbi:unnamed protein product [Paramecium primaurelia]|uniref:Uncharacterized protein n=1 Tax=Paramecium primaurelia TaxID=5886 RepID=A0A8S1P3V8_PARPR|nr:unnamed protein product [Paramecium primaurelia]